jgi:3-hydroxybutyryl-CoA dehydrogenase
MASSQTLLVVGSGTMGAGIAQVAASAGYRTLVYDTAAAQIERGIARVRSDLDKGVQLGKVTADVRDGTLSHLEAAHDSSARPAKRRSPSRR